MKWSLYGILIVCICFATGCEKRNTSDDKQQAQQEKILAEATSQTGMPAITNFRERKIVKTLLELRDQEGLVTYTYLFSGMQGKFVFLGPSVGYGIPVATQYTNPEKLVNPYNQIYQVLPQADPNGLFSPAAAEGTWVMMLNPQTKKVEPQYIEERILVTTFMLPSRLVIGDEPPAAEVPPQQPDK